MPPIDVQTLMLVSTLVLGLLGVMFFIDRARDWQARELTHWGAAFLIAGPAMVLISLRGRVPDWASMVGANAALLLSYGLFLSGTLTFDDRRHPRTTPLVAPAIWLGLCLVPGFSEAFDIRVLTFSLMAGILTALAALSLASGHGDDPLPSRNLTAGVLAAVSLTQLARALLVVVHPVTGDFATVSGSWLASIGLFMLLQTILAGYLLLSLTKERSAAHHRRNAEIDHLTGALARRAFAAEAERHLATVPDRGALLFFDLDHFKEINDTHGHAVGDRVLGAFAELVQARIGPDALFGRWGGEEFVLLLTEADFAAAHRVAEEIRRAFAALPLFDGNRRINVTVSVGIGLPALTGADLDALIAGADAGLYAAKARGRDRVEPGAPRTTVGAA